MLFQNWELMGAWPFPVERMTFVHHSFLQAAQREIAKRERALRPGAAQSRTTESGRSAQLDHAFDIMRRSRP
jgi:hypothetical protein